MKNLLKKSLFLVGLVNAARQIGTDFKRAAWVMRRERKIKDYLASQTVRKLQIGSGPNVLQGWLNTDYRPKSDQHVYMDATQPFPFEDGTFHYVFTEHLIEHLWHREGQFMLKECHRVLRPGGKIRISTPNLQAILSLASPEKNSVQKAYIKMASDKYIPENRDYRASLVINNFFWDFGHHLVYDAETLSASLEKAGFQHITAMKPGESDDPQLSGIEHHGYVIGKDLNQFETMVFQAVKR